MKQVFKREKNILPKDLCSKMPTGHSDRPRSDRLNLMKFGILAGAYEEQQ